MPIVISRQSGVKEVLNDALVVDYWNIDEMADKILTLLNDKALAKASLEKVSSNLRLVTWEAAAEKIINLYEKVI